MDDLQKGRMLVFLQFGLIIILAVYPDSTNVDSRLNIFGIALIAAGLISLFAGFRGLGKSLNANPVPNQDGVLVTTGIYSVVRHPIYLGLLIITLGLVVSSGVWGQALAWLALAILLTYKMRWEEQLLTAKYKGYADYMTKVPAIIPGLKPRKKK
jgi:protein-S-isoprenylcysteine O-methyltransferase Ste14